MVSPFDTSANSLGLSGPVTAKVDHFVVGKGQVDAQTSGLVENHVVVALVGDVDAAHDGVVLGEDRVRHVDGDGAVVVKEVHDKGRHVAGLAEGRWKTFERGLAFDELVRLVLELGDGISLATAGLADLEGRDAHVTAAEVWVLALDATGEASPAIGPDEGLDEAVLSGKAAKVVVVKVAGGLVDVEAVGHALAVQGKGLVLGNDALHCCG